jgi:hypothetical protein
LGCYHATNVGVLIGHVYPQTCGECCNLGYGPQPGVGDDSLVGLSKKVSCRSYGAPDPQQTWLNTTWGSSWQQCAGHGTWDPTLVNCFCDAGWTLVPNGYPGFFNQSQYVCSQCAMFAGPDAHSAEYEYETSTSHTFCNRIYTPSWPTGQLQECGGHGVDLGNGQGCACYNSTTSGFWGLAEVAENATFWVPDVTRRGHTLYVTREVSVMSCVVCNSTFTEGSPETGCR